MEEINGKVGIPGDYFLKMAKADYRNHEQALWREIYQNSIDAGSTEIHVEWNLDERSITVIDDGCGMDLETLTTKLLVLGGTKKPEGATGAFGKAKELELFSWKEYLLHTHNLVLMGSGDAYTITETIEYIDGTSITLYIQENEDFGSICRYAQDVARKTECNCSIYVCGLKIDCDNPKGEFRKGLDVGNIYVNEELADSYHCQVRMNGIWMFEQYVGASLPHCTLELSADSIKALTSNRDGLKGASLRSANEFFNKLAADRKSALHPDKVEITIRAEGEDGDMIHVTDEDMEFMEQRWRNSPRAEFVEGFARFLSMNSEGLDKGLSKMRMVNTNIHDYDRLKYFGFRWDTVHKCEQGLGEQAYEFLDGSRVNAKRAKTLLTMWGETIKQVMLDNSLYRSFTIGFNWDDNQQAQLAQNGDGILHFFLHPKVLETYPLTSKKVLSKKLKQLAVHEVAHIHRSYHDEYFMEEMDKLSERTWDSDKMYDRISKITG